MDNRKERGNAAEKIAQHYLQKKGMVLLHCNYRCRWGELDIVARDKDYLVFVEVRSRWGNRGNAPEEYLRRLKRKRLRDLAYYYLQKEIGHEVACRIDLLVVNMSLNGEANSFNHFKGL